MSESRAVWKFVMLFALVIGFTVIVSGWAPGSPALQGWSDFEDRLNVNPLDSVPSFPTFPSGPCDIGYHHDANGTCVPIPETDCPEGDYWCELWDVVDDVGKAIAWVGQWIGAVLFYVAQVLASVVIAFFALIIWFIALIVGFFGALFGLGAGFSGSFPAEISIILNVVFITFTALVIFTIIKIIRGSE